MFVWEQFLFECVCVCVCVCGAYIFIYINRYDMIWYGYKDIQSDACMIWCESLKASCDECAVCIVCDRAAKYKEARMQSKFKFLGVSAAATNRSQSFWVYKIYIQNTVAHNARRYLICAKGLFAFRFLYIPFFILSTHTFASMA